MSGDGGWVTTGYCVSWIRSFVKIGGYKFDIGQAVQFSPQCARGAPGLYIVTGLLPERDGEFEYCIYNEAEPYQRVAKESELR